MITLHHLTVDDITKDLLVGFDRYQETTHVYYLNNGELSMKEDHFIESWDTKKLETISLYLKDCVIRDGCVLVLKEDDKVIGFGNLEATLYEDTYIHLPYIHITRTHRHQGLGKRLFEALCQEAKKRGGRKLYISTHPSVEAQRFYQSVGCILATTIIDEIFQHEPLDIQLEKSLVL